MINPYRKGRSLPVGLLRWPAPEKRDLSEVDAQLEYGEKELLYQLPLLSDGGPILNLGDGGSTVIFALSLIDHDLPGELISVDNYVDHQRRVHEIQRERFGVTHKVRFIHNTTVNAYQGLATTRLRLLFIDANHSYESCKSDISLYAPLTEGLIAFHDVNQEGVDRAIRESIEPAWDLVVWVNRVKVFQRKQTP